MRTPSSTSASKNLPPSCCVRESAPKPASQICCAESITPRLKRCPDVAASFAALKGSVLSFIGGISGLWKPNVRQPEPDFMDAGSDGDPAGQPRELFTGCVARRLVKCIVANLVVRVLQPAARVLRGTACAGACARPCGADADSELARRSTGNRVRAEPVPVRAARLWRRWYDARTSTRH